MLNTLHSSRGGQGRRTVTHCLACGLDRAGPSAAGVQCMSTHTCLSMGSARAPLGERLNVHTPQPAPCTCTCEHGPAAAVVAGRHAGMCAPASADSQNVLQLRSAQWAAHSTTWARRCNRAGPGSRVLLNCSTSTSNPICCCGANASLHVGKPVHA